jgi:hypothetical protein
MGQSEGIPVTLEMAQSVVTGSNRVTTPESETFVTAKLQETPGTPSAAPDPESDKESSNHTGRPEENLPHEAHAIIAETVERMALLDHVVAVAAVLNDHVTLARGSKLPAPQVTGLAKEAARVFGQAAQRHFVGPVELLTLACPNGFTMLALQHAGAVYMVILTKKGKPALCVPEIQEILDA